MQWSKYNIKMKAESGGFLLYNAGSGSLIHIDDDTGLLLDEIMANPNKDFSVSPTLYFDLRLGGFLVEDGADTDFVNVLKMRRLVQSYSESQLLLTIAPTRDCNFACSYCYEQNRTPSEMSNDTEDRLVEFIRKHHLVKRINITWYGGESLLVFERMRSLNKKIASLGVAYESQIITNGYCLTADVIRSLDELKVSRIQVTIDGTETTHDKRRFLKCGSPTYDKIVGNIHTLMHSGWDGTLNVRVNIDKQNYYEFADVHRFFQQAYSQKFGSQLNVYPGFVSNTKGDCSNHFTSRDKGEFLVDLSKNFGINPFSLFPHMTMGGCTMTRKNAYVIGPDGELYKCWRDFGDRERVTGSLDGSFSKNASLVAAGMIGASYLHDARCEKCRFFPICDGGCSKIRMLNKRDNGTRDTCTYFKYSMNELLEMHFNQSRANV